MAISGWIQVAADPETVEAAGELASELSAGSSLKLSRAQVLRAALAVGVAEIKRDPSRIVEPSGRARRKKASG